MRFSCDSCSAKYTIADEKVRGKVVAVKCSKCGAKITVNGKSLVEPVEEEQAEERTRVASLSDLEALRASAGSEASLPPPVAAPPAAPRQPAAPTVSDGWYAIIDGQQLGPLSAQETIGHAKAGRVLERTYVWKDGLADWKRADEVAELAALFQSPARESAPVPPPPVSEPDDFASEPTPPPDPEPEPQPALTSHPAASPQTSAKQLDRMLFEGEFEDVPTMTGRPLDVASLVAGDLERSTGPSSTNAAPPVDPFASVPDSPSMSQPFEIGEQTRFFMQKAGVTRRNPPWKIALTVFLFIAVPVATLYALSQMRIVKLEITQVDESTGQEVQTPVFSSEGLSGLRDMLLGKKKEAPHKPQATRTSTKPNSVAKPKPVETAADEDGPLVAKADIKFGDTMTEEERKKLEALYKEKGITKPKLDPTKLEKPPEVDGQAALDSKVISETVGKNLKAFQGCTETELKRNPSFKGGKIKVTVTIGSSGVVTKATIDRQDINGSDLGSCLKEKAKRIVFPRFEGEPFDVEIPLILAAGA